MRDALIGLASALVIPFVIITVVSPVVGRWLLLSPLGMFTVSVVFVGVAVYAVGNTVHAFFEFDWSGDSRTRPRPPRELAKTSQIQN